MQFSLKTLLLLVPVTLIALYALDTLVVVKADGACDLQIEIEGWNSEEIVSVSYASLRTSSVDAVVERYPFTEVGFQKVTSSTLNISLPWSSTTSYWSERELDYGEFFDTILFRINYRNQESEFLEYAIPNRSMRDNLKVDFQPIDAR